MIITNWPDKCPKCGLKSPKVLRSAPSTIITLDGVIPSSKNTLEFKCGGSICDYRWTVELVSVDPVVFTHRSIKPLAVVADSVETAKVITALDETWSVNTLSALVARGAERSMYVLEQSQKTSQESPTVNQG